MALSNHAINIASEMVFIEEQFKPFLTQTATIYITLLTGEVIIM